HVRPQVRLQRFQRILIRGGDFHAHPLQHARHALQCQLFIVDYDRFHPSTSLSCFSGTRNRITVPVPSTLSIDSPCPYAFFKRLFTFTSPMPSRYVPSRIASRFRGGMPSPVSRTDMSAWSSFSSTEMWMWPPSIFFSTPWRTA